jgi:hypothetical protein
MGDSLKEGILVGSGVLTWDAAAGFFITPIRDDTLERSSRCLT